MLGFRAVLNDYTLKDMGFVGSKFTWCNRRNDANRIYERLNRYLANSQWCQYFPKAIVYHGAATYSNHLPIWLNIEGIFRPRKVKRPFRFEAMWTGVDGCEQIIKDS
ncbi:hypothetical protein CIPAW_10G075400 [Carya illinoinensis]|uniref:Uncharacterized protein n=1 Tax=Carya illinoinensis TaxID=32201 RepID=A0A8T1P5C9_CARIL|nr:hypothetical protein CIPAW_10G075400 [Carya illinoinensis]